MFIFHVHNMDCIIHWLDFWKRLVAETESFFILGFTYDYKLIILIILLYSLLLKQKEVMLQQLAKTKSKIDIRHPPMIRTHFWKKNKVFNENFLSCLIQKIGYWMQNDQKLRQIRITLFKMVTFPSLLSQQHLSMRLPKISLY